MHQYVRRGHASGGATAALSALVVIATACTGRVAPRPTLLPRAGGTLRVGVLTDQNCEFTFCGGQHDDPQWAAEDAMSYELARCCLVRTLLSYNGQPTSRGGTVLHPDVAAALPEISSDGLTWTFHLKRGLRYAPPLQRVEITAQDFVRSLDRLLGPPPSNAPDYYGGLMDPYLGNYLDLRGLIAGASDYVERKASSISGVEAPDPHTLRIHLSRPDGALATLLSEPDAAPIAPNPSDPSATFGVLQGHARPAWGYVVASGPYMIAGADRLALARPPPEQLPASGDAADSLTLVRNPSWDAATDPLRAAQPDRIVLTPVANEDDAKALVTGGALDLVLNWDAPTDMLGPAAAGPGTRAITDPRDVMGFVDLNPAMPPFDDLNVRRAVDAAIDRRAAVARYEREGVDGVPATHIGLDSEEDNLLLNYDPSRSTTGSPDAARQAMSASRYDRNHDGACDEPACAGIRLYIDGDRSGDVAAAHLIARDLAPIGLHVEVEPKDAQTFFSSYGPRSHIAMRIDEWAKDMTDGSTYFPQLFASPAVGVSDEFTSVLLGATPTLLRKWGYSVRSVPNVDDRIERCLPLAFHAAATCWAELDQYLMTEVVVRVPLVMETTGRVVPARLSGVAFDQSSPVPMPALDRVAVHGSPPAASPRASPQVPGIPDGIYRVTLTKEDLLRFDPHTDPNGVDESTGTFTVFIRDGWFRWVQDADHPVFSPLAAGTYTGSGDRVVFSLLEPPSNAITTPPMRWSFDGRALHLHFLGCGNLDRLDPNAPHLCDDVRALYEAHPWEKIA